MAGIDHKIKLLALLKKSGKENNSLYCTFLYYAFSSGNWVSKED
jgi:hypothetical protein